MDRREEHGSALATGSAMRGPHLDGHCSRPKADHAIAAPAHALRPSGARAVYYRAAIGLNRTNGARRPYRRENTP